MNLEPIVENLVTLNEKPVALSVLDAFAKHSWQFHEYDELAKCYFKIKSYTNAMKYSELALTTAYTNEHMWVARSNLINVLNHANYPDKAMKHIKIAESQVPNDEATRLEKAFSYFLLNDRDSAEVILQEELKRTDISENTRTKIEFNLGTYNLWRDEFQQGLRRFLLEGEKLDYWRKAKLPFKFWDGGAMPGKYIILYAEAGIGDEFINVRFMNHLYDIGMEPIWYTDREDLVEIFNVNGFQATTDMKELMKLDNPVWTYPMSLPVYLGLEYKDLWHGPYIKPLAKYDNEWNLPESGNRLKVGIRWQGNPEYDQDLHRSVPLRGIIDALPKNMDYHLYSLQMDVGLEELEEFPDIIDLTSEINTFGDTLSFMNELDLIITSCTSIAHAAAAMGKRTIVFTPISAYYVWSHSAKQSPWYGDNVSLLRQKRPRVWDEPLEELSQLLTNMCVGDIENNKL